MSDWSCLREDMLNDPEFRAYCNEKQPHADVADAILAFRIEKNLSQKEMAKLTGISQADLSRLENCDGNPSLKTINRLAKGMGCMLRISFVPISSEDAPEQAGSEDEAENLDFEDDISYIDEN